MQPWRQETRADLGPVGAEGGIESFGENQDWSQFHRQLVVPQSLQQAVIQEVHAGVVGGYLGEDKTFGRLRERFYWPGHWTNVREFCCTCQTCASRKTPAPKRNGPLTPVPENWLPHGNGRSGHPRTTATHRKWKLLCSSHFRLLGLSLLNPESESNHCYQEAYTRVLLRLFSSWKLHSDQGRQFESQLISEICKLLKINKTRTAPYHSQGDGLVERFSRTLSNMLATTVKDNEGIWEDHIQMVCLVYDTSMQQTTGYTPFYLMYAREVRIPVDVMFGSNLPEDMPHHE